MSAHILSGRAFVLGFGSSHIEMEDEDLLLESQAGREDAES